MQRPDVKTLIEQNPGADAQLVEQAQQILEMLRANGVRPQAYELENPFSERARITPTSREEISGSFANYKNTQNF